MNIIGQLVIAIAFPGFLTIITVSDPYFALGQSFFLPILYVKRKKKCRNSIEQKFEVFAKCKIELRSVLALHSSYLFDDFKCLLKG